MQLLQATGVLDNVRNGAIQTDELQLEVSIEGYNPYSIPADLQKARNHGQAKKVYASEKKDPNNTEKVDVCECCGLSVNKKQEIPLTASLDKLYHLGAGFPMYFKFIKFCIGMMLVLFLSTGLYNVISNKAADDCIDEQEVETCMQLYKGFCPKNICLKGYILSYTIQNKKESEDLLTAQLALNLFSVILIMFFFHYLRYVFRDTQIKVDDQTTTPADYTIMVEGFPPDKGEDEINMWLEGIAKDGKQIKVERIIRPYEINAYIELTMQTNEMLEHQKALKMNKESIGQKMDEKDEKLYQKLYDKIVANKLQLKKMKKDLKHCDCVFITFEKAEQADYVLSQFEKSLLAKVFQCLLPKSMLTRDEAYGKRIQVKRAPEPSDIIWKNLGVPHSLRRNNKYMTNFTTLVLIVLTFGFIIFVNWLQDKALHTFEKGSSIVQGLSILASVIICVANVVITISIDTLTKFERPLTTTDFLRGVSEKLAVAQFVNTALTTLFAKLILADNTDGRLGLSSINFYGKGGLLENMFWMFITSALLGPGLIVFDPAYFFLLLKRYLASRKGANANMMQKDAQMLFEGPPFGLPAKYAALIKVMLTACFYAPALPFALLLAIATMLIGYWADKYVLLRRCSLPKSINESLTFSMIEYLEWGAFTFAMGNMVYVLTLKNADGDPAFSHGTPMVWIAIGISLFNIIFPMDVLNAKLLPIPNKVTEFQSFEEASAQFATDYDIENPLTRIRALKKRLNKVKGDSANREGFLSKLNKGDFGRFDSGDIQKLFVVDSPETANHIDFDCLDNFAKDQNQRDLTSKMNKPINKIDFGRFFDNFKNNIGEQFMKVFLPGMLNEKASAPEEISLFKFQPNQQEEKDKQGKRRPSNVNKRRDSRHDTKEDEAKFELIPKFLLPKTQNEQDSGQAGHLELAKSPSNMPKNNLELGALNFLNQFAQDMQSGTTTKDDAEIDPKECEEDSEPHIRGLQFSKISGMKITKASK